jgi:hypothetical protein
MKNEEIEKMSEKQENPAAEAKRKSGLDLHFEKKQVKEYMAVLVLGILFGLLLS